MYFVAHIEELGKKKALYMGVSLFVLLSTILSKIHKEVLIT